MLVRVDTLEVYLNAGIASPELIQRVLEVFRYVFEGVVRGAAFVRIAEGTCDQLVGADGDDAHPKLQAQLDRRVWVLRDVAALAQNEWLSPITIGDDKGARQRPKARRQSDRPTHNKHSLIGGGRTGEDDMSVRIVPQTGDVPPDSYAAL